MRRRGKLVFLFRLPGGGNGFAETAGMTAVEGAGHGPDKRNVLQIVGEHGRPGNRLQDGPLAVDAAQQGGCQQKVAEPDKHSRSIVQVPFCVKTSCVLLARVAGPGYKMTVVGSGQPGF